MSTIAPAEPAIVSTSPTREKAATKRLRVWPAVMSVAFVWLALYANHTLELTAGVRFISRMASMALALLAFLGWWLSRSAVRWRDRLLAIAVTFGLGALALSIAHESIK